MADNSLENLQLDLGNIRQKFENSHEKHETRTSTVVDRPALERSESIMSRMQK